MYVRAYIPRIIIRYACIAYIYNNNIIYILHNIIMIIMIQLMDRKYIRIILLYYSYIEGHTNQILNYCVCIYLYYTYVSCNCISVYVRTGYNYNWHNNIKIL